MKTELALSFIFDPTRAEDLKRIMEMLSYARDRGIAVIRGDLDRLDGVRQALGTGALVPMTPAVAPALQCESCRREFRDALVLAYHVRVCPYRAPDYMACPQCRRAHQDTPQGRAQHRRRCPAAQRDPNPTPKEASCDG